MGHIVTGSADGARPAVGGGVLGTPGVVQGATAVPAPPMTARENFRRPLLAAPQTNRATRGAAA